MKPNFLLILMMYLFLGASQLSWSEETCAGLEALEQQVQNDLEKVNIPFTKHWILRNCEEEILDVAIIGGGMSGMTAAFALIKEGITHLKIFDENQQGEEGPWAKCARMNMLRSSKTFMGPALGIPSLTFRAWFEAQHGADEWKSLRLVPTHYWCKYLCWFRDVLKLPVENETVLVKLLPAGDYFELTFKKKETTCIQRARKVVLATGREGFGGLEIPDFMKNIPKHLYSHTGERIDPHFFAGKRIAVIGAGASAFDAAATALENGARSVDMIVRRHCLPQIHKFAQFFYPGIVHGFHYLSDEKRCHFFAEAMKHGTPPPKAALERVQNYSNFAIHCDVRIEKVMNLGESAILQTSRGAYKVDFLVCGTGYKIDVSLRPELEAIKEHILLWKDKAPPDVLHQFPKLGNYPYLGPHFEFQEALPDTAPYVKNIYCFNYGAFLSHGMLSGDIPLISIGATRIAQGIASDFFLSDNAFYYHQLLQDQ